MLATTKQGTFTTGYIAKLTEVTKEAKRNHYIKQILE
jgi:hypothetical protein